MDIRANLQVNQLSQACESHSSEAQMLCKGVAMKAQAQLTSEVFSSLLKRTTALRVLMVEDNELLQKVNKICLEELGFDVVVAESGQTALELFDDSFDFVLMDIQMPGMDGFQTAKLIRENYKHLPTPIVAYTSLDQAIVPACLSAGMNGYLQKPYLLEQLKHHLEMAAA